MASCREYSIRRRADESLYDADDNLRKNDVRHLYPESERLNGIFIVFALFCSRILQRVLNSIPTSGAARKAILPLNFRTNEC